MRGLEDHGVAVYSGSKNVVPTRHRGSENAMNIALPKHIQRFVEQEVQSGRFEDVQEVIVAALESMADDHRIDPEVLAELIAEPLAQIERGETIPWSDDLMDRLSREAESNARRGHQVSDDIKY